MTRADKPTASPTSAGVGAGVLVQRSAGIDISREEVVVCLRTPRGRAGHFQQDTRKFGTSTPQLLRLSDWLHEADVQLIAMESTGQYWKPVYYLLEATFADVLADHTADLSPTTPSGDPGDPEDGKVRLWLVNAQHIKALPGHKTDVHDAAWIAKVASQGLVRPSFVPALQIRQLRDLTRTRAHLTGDRTREVQRLHDVLEEAGVKLATTVTDILGVSGRAMMQALIDGELNPAALADLAKGRARVKTKNGQLAEAMTTMAGRFGGHERFLVAMHLRQIEQYDTWLGELDTRIEQVMNAPEQEGRFQRAVSLLRSIPGLGLSAAHVVLAEIGTDMSRFPTPAHLASWVGVCPGNNQSGPQRKGAGTRPGNRHLKAALGHVAMSAIKVKDGYLQAQYRRIIPRRGKKRALVAVQHSIIVSIWHMLSTDSEYEDLGGDHFNRVLSPSARRRKAHRLASELQAMGYALDPNTLADLDTAA